MDIKARLVGCERRQSSAVLCSLGDKTGNATASQKKTLAQLSGFGALCLEAIHLHIVKNK